MLQKQTKAGVYSECTVSNEKLTLVCVHFHYLPAMLPTLTLGFLLHQLSVALQILSKSNEKSKCFTNKLPPLYSLTGIIY